MAEGGTDTTTGHTGNDASPFFHRKCTMLSISIECEILQPGMKALVLLVNAKQCINLNVSFALWFLKANKHRTVQIL